MSLNLEEILSLPPEKKVDRYCFNSQALLGTGSFSNVFAGFDEYSGDIVAIKTISNRVLNDNFLYKALQAEIEIMKKLDHPNLVKLFNVVSTVNNFYVITEYCNGGDLASRLSDRGRITEAEALVVMADVLKGMKELTKHKIIHRDLKPANIFIRDGIFKIGDFGFAKQFHEYMDQSSAPIVGSPYYMPPKYLEQGLFSIKHDIWSLGVMFYELLVGDIPWPASDRSQLITNIYSKKLVFPKELEISPRTQRFIQKCLQTREEDRASWEEIFEDGLFKIGEPSEIIIIEPDPEIVQPKQKYEEISGKISSKTDFTFEAENSKKETLTSESDFDKKAVLIVDEEINLNFGVEILSSVPEQIRRKSSFSKNKNASSSNLHKIEDLRMYIEFLETLRIGLVLCQTKEIDPKLKETLKKTEFLILKQSAIISCLLSEAESKNLLGFDDWANFRESKEFMDCLGKVQSRNEEIFSNLIEMTQKNGILEALAGKNELFAKVYRSEVLQESKEFKLISDYFVVMSIKEINESLRHLVNFSASIPFPPEELHLVRILSGLIAYHKILNISLENEDKDREKDPLLLSEITKSIDFSQVVREIKSREVDWTFYLGLKLKVRDLNP